MPSHDILSWTGMVQCCSMHRHGKKLLNILNSCVIKVWKHIMLLLFVLSAYSHAGLVNEHSSYFDSMGSVYSTWWQLNTTLLDLLGCAGHLQVAEDMINWCPMWRALLGACRIHSNVEMKEMVTKQVVQVDLDNASGYVLLGTGFWVQVFNIREWKGAQRNSQKVNDKVHTFLVNH